MTDDNIITMPTPLNILAGDIRDGTAQRLQGRDAWVAGTLKLGRALVQARDHFQSNNAFGVWLLENELTRDLSDNDRASLITMAREPELLHEVLSEQTGQWQPDTIYRNNVIRFGTRPKTAPPPAAEPNPVESTVAPSEPAAEPSPVIDVPKSATTLTLKTPAPRTAKTESTKGAKGAKVARLFPEDAPILLDRFNNPERGYSKSLTMICAIGEKHGGKQAVAALAEAMRQHPHWQATREAQKVSIKLLHQEFQTAHEYGATPSGLRRAIAAAIEAEKRKNDPPAWKQPRDDLRKARNPVDDVLGAKPYEKPSEDEDIIVYGTLIRGKGEWPESYLTAWATLRYMEVLMSCLCFGERLDRRGAGILLRRASHYLRDAQRSPHAMLHYWSLICQALEVQKDPEAGFQYSRAVRL